MISIILNDYKTFSDSVINKIEFYDKKNDSGEWIELSKIHLFSYNWSNDKFENIILTFENIEEFRFIKQRKMSSTVITDALLKYENGEIVFDFFPKQYSGSLLEIDPYSDFLIRCEKIYLEKI
ncbi:hypothetical protein [Chryseobacterium nepalense]|uniref:Uncharacterized protein n=1 Tax=Chryseobacterium nepalense TaxID=1854498 RepID=A0ABY4K4J2_9FLAO|nr:hypothetical protein [Chryseobacterium nepalense]UPQ75707.1 hypothetical protein M0D58_16865 [Chryseobacterium nepalense]